MSTRVPAEVGHPPREQPEPPPAPDVLGPPRRCAQCREWTVRELCARCRGDD